MRFNAPHPIPYQGSKRQLAASILSFIPAGTFERMVEPFAGSAAVTLLAAQKQLMGSFIISDILKPLADIWTEILERPSKLADEYEDLWLSQVRDPESRYYEIRAEYNTEPTPAKLLFLLARCVKNAV